LALLGGAVAAAPVTLVGITFSDEEGGVVLHGGSGRGTADDPFVLVEDITDEGPAILTIRGLEASIEAGRFGGQAVGGFSLVKLVTNRTGHAWHAFELELRERLDRPSTYEDGLSFGQATRSLEALHSDRFSRVHRNDEPLDAVVFDDGLVPIGATVAVRMMITDYTPRAEFFLLQRREGQIARLGDG
jgi:hypothetical protein